MELGKYTLENALSPYVKAKKNNITIRNLEEKYHWVFISSATPVADNPQYVKDPENPE